MNDNFADERQIGINHQNLVLSVCVSDRRDVGSHFTIRPESVTYSTRCVQPHSSLCCYLLTPGWWPLSRSDFDLVSTDGRFYLLLLFVQSFVLCPHNCSDTMFPQSCVMKLKYHFNIQLWECPLFFFFFWKGGVWISMKVRWRVFKPWRL